jgi:hypothetical protein
MPCCRRHKCTALQEELDAAQQQAAALQQQLHRQQQVSAESGSASRQQAATSSLLQQQLEAAEAKLLDMAQLHGHEQQQCQTRLEAAVRAHESEVRWPESLCCSPPAQSPSISRTQSHCFGCCALYRWQR